MLTRSFLSPSLSLIYFSLDDKFGHGIVSANSGAGFDIKHQNSSNIIAVEK
jgi:hypothetical protein